MDDRDEEGGDIRRVLIAGAGPTGLMLANSLAAYGVPFDIIDRKSAPSVDSKALAVNVATQYALALLGIGDAVGSSGCRVRRANVYFENVRLNAIDFRRLDFSLQSFITQPQAQTERELVAALGPRKSIAWNTQLLDVRDIGHSVVARVRDASGVEREQAYDQVVGCEGKNSVVRDAIGAKLSGHDYPMHFLLGDFPLVWKRPSDQAYYQVFEETFFVVVPLGDGYWRVVVKRDGPFDPANPVLASDITELFERYVGKGLIVGEPRWLSGAPFYMRTVDRMSRGRLHICGDAAHLFSPIGGTGMNTGIQDAVGLAWRLAYVCQRFSPRSLFDDYECERLEAIARAAAAADGATRLIARLERSPERILPLLPNMRRRRLLRETLPRQQAGLTLEYTKSSGIHCAGGAKKAGAGSLCLPLLELRELVAKRGTPVHPLETSIFVFVDGKRSDRAVEVMRLTRALERFSGCRVALHAFDVSERPAPGSTYVPILASRVRRLLPIEDALILAVRPDAIIAFEGTLDHLEELEAWLSRNFIGNEMKPPSDVAASSRVDRAVHAE